jgi:uncharacterized membrane protein YjjP (DUF1212 family)
MIACSWKDSFGIECPACGFQRSFLHLINGDFYKSLDLFPALIPIIILFLYVSLHLIKPKIFAANFIVFNIIVVAVLMIINWLKII